MKTAATSGTDAETLSILEFPQMLDWLAEYAVTPPGKAYLAAVRPHAPIPVAEARRRRGVQAQRALRAQELPGSLRCGDIEEWLRLLHSRVLDSKELLAIADTLECFLHLRRWGSQNQLAYGELAQTAGGVPDLRELLDTIRVAIDARGEVKDEADPDLAKVRQELRQLHRQRDVELEKMAERWQQRGLLRQRQPVQRGQRQLLAVRATHQGRSQGIVHDRSQSGDTVFVEPATVIPISNRIASEQAHEQQIVHRILSRCSRAVLAEEAALQQGAERMAEFDAAVAAATWAQESAARFPEFGDHLEIVQGRHPLLQRILGRDHVAPLTLSLGRDFDLLVVTGPNTGGKTVVLKTVGLLTLLAMCGLPVPVAEGSQFVRVPGVAADIGDQQSLESSLSTFSGHLRGLLNILKQLQPGYMVLLDELGTGTDPEEGAALGQAVLETLLQRGAWVLATTHLGSLKLFSTQVTRAENASMEFDPATLAPQYRLLVGVPGASHALEVAEIMGLPASILERARRLSRRSDQTESLIADISRVRREAEELHERARDQEAAARDSARRMEEEEGEWRRLQETRRMEAEVAFRDLQVALEGLLDGYSSKIKTRLNNEEREDLRLLVEQSKAVLANHDLGRRWRAFLKSIRKGDVVYVPRYREKLRVLKNDSKRGRVKVRSGNLEIELPIEEITWVTPPPGPDPS